jgi:urease accessory protein
MQSSDFRIAPSASLFLLPSAVTCFADASYSQKQRFQLADSTSSLILLDAFTSGRMARHEEWQFQRYRSENEVFIGEDRVLKDVMLLEAPSAGGSISDTMAGYSCFANLFLFGAATIALQDHLTTLFRAEMQYRSSKAPPLLWSYAELLPFKRAGVIRVAGTTTEAVMTWLAGNLGSLEGLLGPDLFRQIWS